MITRTVIKALNARTGKPDTSATNPGFLLPGTSVGIVAMVKGKSIEGNDTWYQSSDGHFYWSGGFDRSISDSVMQLMLLNPVTAVINYNSLFEGIDPGLAAGQGAGISIAILDSGINSSHKDLSLSAIKRKGCFNDTPGTDTSDKTEDGHGTHTAGLIAAMTGSKNGITGIAPKCTASIYKVLTDDGSSAAEFLVNALDDIRRNGPMPDIINMSLDISWASYSGNTVLQQLLDDITQQTICVAAAGNDTDLLASADALLAPAIHPGIISAGAVSQAFFAGNPAPVFNDRLDIIIPEFSLFSCSNKDNNSYRQLDGSSMSAALTSGLIALLAGRDSSLKKNPAKVRQALNALAKPWPGTTGFNSFSIIKTTK